MSGSTSTNRRVAAIRAIHTLIWAIVEAAVGYLLFAGFTKRRGRLVTLSAVLVIGETAIFVANGCRCPLTEMAEAAGAESGSVTDIYLPAWLARSLPAIHVPLAVVIVYLHRDRIRRIGRSNLAVQMRT